MDPEFAERFDRFLDRFDRHIERMSRRLDGIDNEIRLTRELHAEYMQETRETRRGYRLMTTKLFRVVEDNSEAMREIRETSQAHTKAILSLLDRLDNDGSAPAPG